MQYKNWRQMQYLLSFSPLVLHSFFFSMSRKMIWRLCNKNVFRIILSFTYAVLLFKFFRLWCIVIPFAHIFHLNSDRKVESVIYLFFCFSLQCEELMFNRSLTPNVNQFYYLKQNQSSRKCHFRNLNSSIQS